MPPKKERKSFFQQKVPLLRMGIDFLTPQPLRPLVGPLLRKKELPEPTVEQTARFGKELLTLPALTRQGISFGLGAQEGLTGKRPAPFRPKSDFGRFLLEPTKDFKGVKSQPQRTEEALSFGQKHGGTPGALGAGVIGAPLLSALEVTPGGGAKKQAAKKTSQATKYVKTVVTSQKAAKTAGKAGFLTRGLDFLKELKIGLVDKAAPIEDTLRKAQKEFKFEVRPTFDISDQISRVLRAPTLASQFAKDKGIVNTIKQVDNIDEFDQFLIAKRALEVNKKGIKTGRNLAEDANLVEAFSSKYDAGAQEIKKYTDSLLDYMAERGLISRELSDFLKKDSQSYVPLNRIIPEIEEVTTKGTRGLASLSKQSIVQRLKGSKREIESPLESLLDMTNRAFAQGERNRAGLLLTGYKDIPTNPFGLRQVTSKSPAKLGEDVIFVLRDGKKEAWVANKDIVRAAKNLDSDQFNILAQIALVPTRIARVGITGVNPAFLAANLVKDQLFAFVTGKGLRSSPLAHPGVFLKALANATKHGKLYDEMIRAGGAGTRYDIARKQAPLTIKKIRSERGPVEKAKFLATNPGQLFRALEDTLSRGEELTRLQQFQGEKAAQLRLGRTAEDAAVLAGKAARENTVDFLRFGEYGRVLNAAVLYLNAQIQGARRLIQALKARPFETSVKLGTLSFATASAVAWALSDPKRKEAYEDISPFEKENNIILVPPNPVKDEDGKWNVTKIPLPPGVSSPGNFVRKGVESMYDTNEVKFRDFADALVGTVTPVDLGARPVLSSLTPQAVKPPLELLTNQSFFTGSSIVPPRLEKASPELQFTETTGGTARLIGKKFGVSPLKLEFGARAVAGQVGSNLINASDRALAKSGIIPEDQIGGESVSEGVNRRFRKAFGGEIERGIIEKIQEIETARVDQKVILHNRAEVLYSELKELPGKEANRRLNEVAQEVPQIVEEIIDIRKDEVKGLTISDRFTKSLGVENGDRARFIIGQTKEMKTGKEKNAYINGLVQKGVVSANVLAQIAAGLRQGQSPQDDE